MLTPTCAPALMQLCAALWQRHTAALSFQEIRRGLVALSQDYTARRSRVGRGMRMGRGKQAAFALGYAPRHFALIHHIVSTLALEAGLELDVPRIIDLGCGTGVVGAAWALCANQRAKPISPEIVGIDTDPWALGEARWLYRTLGLCGRTQVASMQAYRALPPGAVVVGWAANELADGVREQLFAQLLRLQRDGMQVLIVEPIARNITPFWASWCERAQRTGGIWHEWRLRIRLSDELELLSRAAHLDHRELTARSLLLPANRA